MPAPFTVFGAQHLGTIAAIAILMVVAPLGARLTASRATASVVGAVLGIILILSKVAEPIYVIAAGESWQPQLPLHLCDVGAIAIGLFLLRAHRVLFILGYFWRLGGGLHAILTPDIAYGFPSASFLLFFFTHGLWMVWVAYAIGALGNRLELKSVWLAYLVTIAFAATMYPVNLLLGTNYLYLMRKPYGPSLIDYLGPWPWYLLSLFGVALAFFLIYYAPFAVLDRLNKRRS
jgi:hypothetical integral membrane protein (TIGR02206 family)